jgi:hypothetical protein
MRYQVRGPHPSGGYAKWTVIDTQKGDLTIDDARRKKDAMDAAKELNDREAEVEAEILDEATRALHENPCPGCGFEPEVVNYYRRKSDKVRVGYDCTCGAHVVNGVVLHMGGSR